MSHLNPHGSEEDQVFQRYLDRAIRDINELSDEIGACGMCDHDSALRVLGTGHPLADVMLVKHAPGERELEEGVAFHGRSGEAVMASAQRLAIDPLDLYGTNAIKCAPRPTDCQRDRCPGWLVREIRIVEPRMLVVMGDEARVAINALDVPGAEPLADEPGTVQRWTHTCEALVCPDIDASLDRPASKQAFWRAFRELGEWYGDRPPF